MEWRELQHFMGAVGTWNTSVLGVGYYSVCEDGAGSHLQVTGLGTRLMRSLRNTIVFTETGFREFIAYKITSKYG